MIESWIPANMKALLEHVPMAEAIIKDAGSSLAETEVPFENIDADILCKEGISFHFYEQAKGWLDAKEGRRLFWIEDRPESLARLVEEPAALELLKDCRTKIFYVQGFSETVAKKIAWMSAFKQLVVISASWKSPIEMYHRAAQLITSDAADFGAKVARHWKANTRLPLRSLAALQGSMKERPPSSLERGLL